MYYLASPYSSGNDHSMKQNYYDVVRAQANLLKNGLTVISPIAAMHVGANMHSLPKTYGFWKDHCLNMLACCDGIIVLKINGWDKSNGVKDEIEFWTIRNVELNRQICHEMYFSDLDGSLTPFEMRS